jgi:O-acetylhomoserine/O-acetylserine sulfhydrylase-like pyridoxal-dependent enzyme
MATPSPFSPRGWPVSASNVRLADFTDPDALAQALAADDRLKLVYFETLANPNLRIIDIAGVSSLAKSAGALTIVDNTFATPILQYPLKLGADLVVHSATKYLGGHGDLLGGAGVGSSALIERIRGTGLRALTGATLSPLNAFLILRGLKTLEVRMERHSRSAQQIAELLERHPLVSHVAYPGLKSFAQYELAQRQMRQPVGLIAFELEGGFEAGMAFMNRLELVVRTVSLGDAETLVQHPASMTHATYSADERKRHGISDNLLRLSVGLENVEDLMADIAQALRLEGEGWLKRGRPAPRFTDLPFPSAERAISKRYGTISFRPRVRCLSPKPAEAGPLGPRAVVALELAADAVRARALRSLPAPWQSKPLNSRRYSVISLRTFLQIHDDHLK